MRNRGVSQTMSFLVIPRSLLRGGFIPVGPLSRRKHVDEVSAVAGHQDMLARNDHGGNHDVGIALPPAILASQEQTLGKVTCFWWAKSRNQQT